MRLVAAVLALTISAVTGSTGASSAQISCGLLTEAGKCAIGVLRGTIAPGDYDKVRKLVDDAWPNLFQFDLRSNGGSVYEGIKIGRLFRKSLLTAYVPKSACQSGQPVSPPTAGAPTFDPSKPFTVVPAAPHEGCICASACALIWFGGIERMGTVGLHRPRIDDPDFANSPPEEATKIYRRALAEIEAYLVEMEAPRPIIDMMLATGSASIRWVDAGDDGLSRPPSLKWTPIVRQPEPCSKV